MRGVIRDGELTEQSLCDAVSDELARGHEPALIRVGSAELEETARRILHSDAAPKARLRVSVAAVELDSALGEGEWQLHEAGG